MLHVCLERSLQPDLEQFQKNNHLIFGRKLSTIVLLNLRGVVTEIVFRRHLRKRAVSLVYKANMRRILFGGMKKPTDSELRMAAIHH